jgi:myo-inositol-1-phosphate synthase
MKRAILIISGPSSTFRGDFGRAAVSISLVLEDEDSPNSGNVIVDAIRAAKVLRNTGHAHRAKETCGALA